MEFKRRRELKHTKIEIIPMIDTMFFLLVFFMLSSLALTKLNGLPVNLPQASSAQKQQASDITITIDGGQHIFVNKQARYAQHIRREIGHGSRRARRPISTRRMLSSMPTRQFRTGWSCIAWTRRGMRESRSSALPLGPHRK